MKFRRWVILPLLMLLVLSSWSLPPSAKAAPITMLMDGRTLESDVPPFIKSNTALVPLRVITSGIGASINWNKQTQTVVIEREGESISLTLGSKTAKVNGTAVLLDVPMQAVQNRTLAPLRFVGEHLGLTVNWNQASNQITLNSGGGTLPTVPPITVPQPGEGQSGTNPAPQGEMRGAWIASAFNIDWPSTSSIGNAAKQKQEYISMLDDLQNVGINAVFVQVRPSADALYPSSLVPWSQYLTGKQGQNPGYDPLAFMIEETHKRGMEFHAWFNPFRASSSTDTSKLAKNHVAIQHPEWIVKQGGKLYINPGIPAARAHIISAVMEVVNNYDIDGVHLDDYFYPSGETAKDKFNDDATFTSYNSTGIKNKGDWRRDNINQFVQQLGAKIHAAKPDVSFGISPFGIWRNKATDVTGSNTSGNSAYDSMYADARTWIRNSYIDYIAPQVYWSFSTKNAPYDKVVDWWATEVKGTPVKLYIGHAPYKVGTPEVGWQTASEIVNQLKYNEQYDQIQGSIFYSASSLRKNPLGLISLLKSYFGQ
ncbi:hypothetical protein DCC85_13365 [Paenibacillus sp. CAA11]|uniref:family 10 glycosylhydrolase n=1 Tax=Paenibacillus sp. CAA11 TaxID=1532905 RepID=UPI000D37A5D5|nr:family 10 glycosylhydrolase [Paenibacillus sp. CAA11]AWB45115.1 hypothetical protein DCC85_13365 [Paenibacillus sp. CAA11]